jgi:hypothetical protein
MSDDIDGDDLTPEERARLNGLTDLLADESLWAEPSPSLEGSVAAAIAAERSAVPVWRAPAGVDTGAEMRSGTANAGVRSIASARSRRWLTIVGAAVASAAAAVLITTAVVHRRDEPSSASEAPAPTSALGAHPGATSAAGPSALVTLSGTGKDPGLTGTANLTSQQSGVRIDLRLTGLPRRDNGDFYQVWLKTCDGTKLVPAGSFHELDSATAWAGVSFAAYPIITVTEETAVGSNDPAQASSGVLVASGQIGSCG